MVNVADVINYAKAQFGKPYVFGATGPGTFDCSGLVQFVFHHFGVDLPRTSQQQAKVGASVDRSKVAAGDLIFSDWGDGPNSHVGIYDGNGGLINAPKPGDVVSTDKMNDYYWQHVTAIRRVSDLSGSIVGTAEAAVGEAANSIIGPLVKPLTDIANAAGAAAKVADLVTKAFLPTNFIRIACGIVGAILILMALRMLVKEVR
jgi:hypothetical protein